MQTILQPLPTETGEEIRIDSVVNPLRMRSPVYIAAHTGSNLETSAIGQVTGGLIKPLAEDSAVMLALIRSTYRNDQIARQRASYLGYCRDLLDAVAIGQYPHWT